MSLEKMLPFMLTTRNDVTAEVIMFLNSCWNISLAICPLSVLLLWRFNHYSDSLNILFRNSSGSSKNRALFLPVKKICASKFSKKEIFINTPRVVGFFSLC